MSIAILAVSIHALLNLDQITKIHGKTWDVGHGLGLDEVKLQLDDVTNQ